VSPADYQALVDDLIRDEGLRLKPYLDEPGKTTIGVGRNLTDNGISEQEAHYLLSHDIERALADAQSYSWFADLDPVRQRVVINMLFNLGKPRFDMFRHTIAAIARKNYDIAADQMLSSQWAKQVGARAERLARMMRMGA